MKQQQQKGEDTFGNQYSTINDMWSKELGKENVEEVKGRVGNEQAWYSKQVQYWDVS